jgi:hypothetical protein
MLLQEVVDVPELEAELKPNEFVDGTDSAMHR